MIVTDDRLKSLTVVDAMSHNLITISCNSTLSEAADVLCEHKISGAPVIDECGRCVGVISGSDFIHSKAEELDHHAQHHELSTQTPLGSLCIQEIRRDLVRSHMTPVVRTIGENAPLVEAARHMRKNRIHRLIVVDDGGRPSGILSCLDLVGTLIEAVED